MLEENRKVQQFGKHSFCLVLPKGWIRANDVKAHDTLKVFVTGHALVVIKPEYAGELRSLFVGGV